MRYKVKVIDGTSSESWMDVVLSLHGLADFTQRNFDQMVKIGDKIEITALAESVAVTELKKPQSGTIEIPAESMIIDDHQATLLQLAATTVFIVCECALVAVSFNVKACRKIIHNKHWRARTGSSGTNSPSGRRTIKE